MVTWSIVVMDTGSGGGGVSGVPRAGESSLCTGRTGVRVCHQPIRIGESGTSRLRSHETGNGRSQLFTPPFDRHLGLQWFSNVVQMYTKYSGTSDKGHSE